MSYKEKAFEIIKSSIKSAVFIDENAMPFYSEDEAKGTYEEELSKTLYTKFKDVGISLAVHKFQKGDENDSRIKNYLFESRDLVLLDWNLDGQEGADYSLKLISEIVEKPNIHFCAVYTSNSNLNEVFRQLACYFNGKSETELNEIRSQFEAYENELKPIIDSLDIFSSNSLKTQIKSLSNIEKGFIHTMKERTGESNLGQALKFIKFAFSNDYKPNKPLPTPVICEITNQVLVIGNTVITILSKNNSKDSNADADSLIRNLSNQISDGAYSFTQLLGFEMQSTFSKESSFLDSNILKVSKDALLSHRKQMMEKDGNDTPFKILIKNLLIEHATLSLRNAKLLLLEESFLDEETSNLKSNPILEDLLSMNVFYNSVHIKNSSDGNIKSLNFGDVFKDTSNNYFICITALCDCYLPSKIKNNYFFSQGVPISAEKAIKMGETAFISYLPDGKVISWILPELIDKIMDPEELPEDSDKETLEISKLRKELIKITFEKEQYESFIYKPAYVKPVQYHVTNHKLVDDKIEITRIETPKGKKADFKFKELTYITSIRPNYAQRIANHAFSHPLRVGVDFVKAT